MQLSNKELFFNNLDYLFSLAKSAGYNKKTCYDEMNVDITSDHQWRKRGAIGKPSLDRVVKFFSMFVDDLTLEGIMNTDITNKAPKFRMVNGGANITDISEKEHLIIQKLRSLPLINREAIMEMIFRLK